jgi:hypothetical protein
MEKVQRPDLAVAMEMRFESEHIKRPPQKATNVMTQTVKKVANREPRSND